MTPHHHPALPPVRRLARRIARHVTAVALFAAASLAGGAILGACAGDGGDGEGGGVGTTGQRVTLATAIAPAPLAFTNDEGWSVEVRRAIVSIGALHYFSGEPLESAEEARAPTPVLERLVRGLAVRDAHAHPGHYVEGDARGEMLSPTTVDLAAGPVTLAAGDGITGLVRSARFTWGAAPEGPLAAELGGAVVLVEGRATRQGETRFFRLRATAAELPDGDATVDGCVFERVEVEGDGAVTVTVDPSVWLGGADFADAPEGADGAPADVPAGMQPANAFLRGLAKGGAFRFRFDPS